MRKTTLAVIVALALAACGDGTPQAEVDAHLDALRPEQDRFRHSRLPSTERYLELHPHATRESRGGPEVRQRLLDTAAGRALLEAGAAAVAALGGRIQDPDRGLVAASVLAEIGGEAAARTLLDAWRRLREGRTEYRVYTAHGERDAKVWSAVDHREGFNDIVCGEVVTSLAWAGRPASAAIAEDTMAALEAAVVLDREGEPLRHEEGDDRKRRAWYIGPVQTALEGMHMLAMMGAPEGKSVYLAALRTPVGPFRFNAIQDASWLGEDAAALVPAMATLLDDPELGSHVLQHLSEILDLPRPPEDQTESERKKAVADLRAVIRERGL